jgi:hypothetical protein
MTEKIAAGRKTDPFEDVLLAQARLCHEEMLVSFKAIRDWEGLIKNRKVDIYDGTREAQRELENISRFIADTTSLAKAAARLRGQNIRVVRATETDETRGEGVSENAHSIPQENIAANDGAVAAAE